VFSAVGPGVSLRYTPPVVPFHGVRWSPLVPEMVPAGQGVFPVLVPEVVPRWSFEVVPEVVPAVSGGLSEPDSGGERLVLPCR